MKYIFTLLFTVNTLLSFSGTMELNDGEEKVMGTVTLAGTTDLTTENPLVASSTNNILMAFTLTSDGQDTITTVEFNTNIDLTGDLQLATSRLYVSSTSEVDYSMEPYYAQQTGSNIVEFTNMEQPLTTSELYFFLVTDISEDASHNSSAIQITLSADNITLKDGTVTGETLSSENFIFETICASNDRAYLINLFNSTNGGSWTNNDSWTNGVPLSDWYGITTNENGCVSEIVLNNNNIVGEMPEIPYGALLETRNLDLAVNQLSGGLPSSLSNMTSIVALSLQSNQFSGRVPSVLYILNTLEQLRLSDNQLSGDIAHAIQNLSSLQLLDLSGSGFEGKIPSSLGNIQTLTEIYLQDNSLTGPIPSELENLVNLERFSVAGNTGITGGFPEFLYFNPNVKAINLDITSLAGSVTEDIISLGLENFDISSTQLCEPTSTAYTDWTSTITNYGSSTISCEAGTINGLSKGITNGRLGGGDTDQAVAGFSVSASSDTQLTDLTLTTSGDLSSFSDLRLVLSTDDDFSTSGDNSNIASFSISSNSISVSALTVSVGTGVTNLFVVGDVSSSANRESESVEFDIVSSDITLSNADVFATSTIEFGPYSFESSLESRDRAALEAFYVTTNGQGWYGSENWLTDEPLADWQGITQGGLIAGKWSTNGDDLATFKDYTSFPSDPEELFELNQFEAFSNIGDNYGLRIAGVIEAPESGDYTFWIVGDDEYELYLSPDNTRGNASLIASGTAQAQYDWTADASQQSNTVSLVAGNQYYIEAVFVEFGGADHVAVGWTLPSDASTTSGPTEIIPASVFVDDKGVQAIDLRINNLSGNLPGEIGNLTDLRFINLQENNISGAIPYEIESLTNLQRWVIWGNQLTGEIPTSIGNLSSLVHLNLDNNNIGGSIPTEIGNLTNMQLLSLSNNGFSGEIPVEIGNLSSLYFLRINGTQLSGTIPDQIGNLTDLTFLTLNGNNLSGSVPSTFNNLTNMVTLSMYGNELSGSFPDFSNLTSLSILNLRDNDFSGEIPAYLNDMTSLTQLYLSDNAFTGQLPDLQNLTNLEILWLHRNSLTGPVPVSYSNLTSMLQFAFFTTGLCEVTTDANYTAWKDALGNQYYPTGFTCDNALFSGLYDEQRYYLLDSETDVPLFKWMVTSEDGGTFDGVTFNYTRTLEGELSNFRVIQSTDDSYETTDDNVQLTGLTIVDGTNSISLDGFNQAMSSDPVYYILIADVSGGVNYDNAYIQLQVTQDDMRSTDIAFNDASWYSADYFFESICSTNGRGILTTFYNITSGKSWFENSNWTNTTPLFHWSGVVVNDGGCVTELYLSNNNINGELTSGLLANLFDLSILELQDNNLFGEIPSDFENFESMVNFDLGRNNLSGNIPDIFQNWTQINTFGLAGNNLEGEIPPSLGDNISLRNLYLDSNSLSGEIPSSLDNLTGLEQLFVAYNDLSGAFPVELTTSGTLTLVGFDNTNICEPFSSSQYNTWKDNVIATGFFSGTDITCATDTEITTFAFLEDTASADFTNAPTISFLINESTDERFLTAEYTLSNGASVLVSDVLQESGVTVNDFTDDVIYRVVAEDGVTTQDWTINVNRPVNNEAEMVQFSLPQQNGDAIFSTTEDVVDIEVVYATDRTNLVPEFVLSPGATSTVNDVSQESAATEVDFSSGSATYVVTSEDLAVVKNWTVNVSVALNDSTDIKSLAVNNVGDINLIGYGVNSDIASWTIGVYNQASFPNLILDYELSGDATAFVGGTEQTSGVSSNNFNSGPVEYLIRAQDGTERTWTVELEISPNIDTEITLFEIDGQNTATSYDNSARSISLEMPVGTSLNNLVPNYDLSFGATAFVNTIEQESGSTAVDFSQGPVSYLVRAEDGTTSETWTVEVTALVDNEDPQVQGLTTPSTYDASGGGDLEVIARATDNLGLESVSIFYKKSSESSFSSEELEANTDGNYSKVFQANDLDNIGINYYFQAIDGVGNTASTDIFTTKVVIADDSRTITNVSSGTSVENYRIIAFPFNNPSASALLDELGTYDKTKWRLLRWNNGSYQDLNQFNSLSAGVGYFYLSKDPVSLMVGGESVNLIAGEYRFPLNSTGYHLIGNPFIGTLTWSEVVQYNIDNGYISSGDVSTNLIGYVSGEVNRSALSPFEGAWLQVNSGSPNFVIPVTASNGSGREDYSIEEPSSFNLNASNWELTFYLKGKDLVHNIAGVGLNRSASEVFDHHDLNLAPKFSEYLSLVVDNQFTRNIKPNDRIVKWDLNVNSTLNEKEFTLAWDQPLSNQYSLLLVDRGSSRVVDLSKVQEISIKNDSNLMYELVFGREDELFEYLNLDFSTISLLYPNPVEDHINIEMYSHMDGWVNCELTNLNGQVLVNQDFMALKGSNTLQMSMQQYSSLNGILLLNITTPDGQTISRKIIKR
ncbi:MAG: PA14 domain-containing protein [bacterium]|nr:PA14 domain-containing protein [bacterium]